MRRTRSGLVDTSSEPRNNMATLKAVAAALQSASLPTGPLGQRRKREGSPGLMTGDTRKYVPEHQDFLSLQQKPMGSSQPEMLLSRGLTMMIMLFTVLSRNQLLVRTLRRDVTKFQGCTLLAVYRAASLGASVGSPPGRAVYGKWREDLLPNIQHLCTLSTLHPLRPHEAGQRE